MLPTPVVILPQPALLFFIPWTMFEKTYTDISSSFPQTSSARRCIRVRVRAWKLGNTSNRVYYELSLPFFTLMPS